MTDRLRIGACLSLTGRFAQFGRQAAIGLEAWRSLNGDADLIVEDDRATGGRSRRYCQAWPPVRHPARPLFDDPHARRRAHRRGLRSADLESRRLW